MIVVEDIKETAVEFHFVNPGNVFKAMNGLAYMAIGPIIVPYGGSVRNAVDLKDGVPAKFQPSAKVYLAKFAELRVRYQ